MTSPSIMVYRASVLCSVQLLLSFCVHAYNDDQIQQLVDAHNEYRRKEGSCSDMQKLHWDPHLATLAQEYADTCVYAHGQSDMETNYTGLGQNIYLNSGVNTPLTDPVYKWWRELYDYTMSTGACKAGKICGHYTQLVWDDSKYVGCAETRCAANAPTMPHEGRLVVCNYWPGGNLVGRALYKTGSQCSECSSGQGYCDNGLCDNCKGKPSCECKIACKHGEVTDDCTCKCADGSDGLFCEEACVDSHVYCGNGWPLSFCTDQRYVAIMKDKCRKFCGLCSECNIDCKHGERTSDCKCRCEAGFAGKFCDKKIELCVDKHPWCGDGWPLWYCTVKKYVKVMADKCPKFCGVCE